MDKKTKITIALLGFGLLGFLLVKANKGKKTEPITPVKPPRKSTVIADNPIKISEEEFDLGYYGYDGVPDWMPNK